MNIGVNDLVLPEFPGREIGLWEAASVSLNSAAEDSTVTTHCSACASVVCWIRDLHDLLKVIQEDSRKKCS